MLPKFNGNYDEDAYDFLQEFEDLCSTISFKSMTRDGILLRVIPFALKSNAKKWFNSLPAESIKTWEEFVSPFLKKYFPRSKSIELRTQIIGFRQFSGEKFWKYFERFKSLLAECPNHGISQTELLRILYEGLDMKTRAFVESMCHEGFITRTVEEAWEYLEGLDERSAEWESTSERDHGVSRNSVRYVDSAFENSTLATISKRLEALEKSQTPKPVASLEITSLSCTICGGLDHFDEDCQVSPSVEQTNAVYPYQKAKNDPFSNTYNPGYRNHPNFSWSQGAQNQTQPQQYPRGVYPKPRDYPKPKSLRVVRQQITHP